MNIKMLSVVLFLLIDYLFLIYKFDYDFINFKSQFWILHFINCAIFYYFNEKITKIKLEFYDLLIMFLPVLGFVLLIFKFIFFFDGKYSSKIEDSSELMKKIQKKKELEEIVFALEINTLGVYEILNAKTPKEKKEFIMKFDFPDDKFKINFYKKSLEDDDIEVIHYAAVEINKIDEKFQKNIKELEKNKETHGLIDTLIEYCESGLLSGSVLKSYQKKAVRLLENIEDKSDKIIFKLLKLYYQMEEQHKCKIILDEKIKNEECDKEILKFSAMFYYNENNFEMYEIIQKKISEKE